MLPLSFQERLKIKVTTTKSMNSISYLSVSSQFIQQQSKNFVTGPRVCPRTISGHRCTVVWVDALVSDFDAFDLIGTDEFVFLEKGA